MPELPAKIKAGLKRKVGPLPVWAWLGVGAAGIGIGVYLRRRSSSGGVPTDDYYSPADPGGAAFPTGSGAGFDPAPGYDYDTPPAQPVPEYPDIPEEPSPILGDIMEPLFVECPEGFVLDIFGRCVPDPAMVATPDTGEAPRGDLNRRQQRVQQLTRRIHRLQRGGVSAAERRQIQRLRQRRRRLRGRRR